jgi:hypothetical protein
MSEDEAQMIFQETKTLLVRYLAPYMSSPKAKPKTKKTSP